MEKNIFNNVESKEKKKLRILFIDDDTGFLEDANKKFSHSTDLVVVECHNTEEALQAIKDNDPDVVFLDHQLTPGGEEGMQVIEKGADLLKGKKVYSTTRAKEMDIAMGYLQKGVEIIGKDLDKAKEIIQEDE